MKMCLIANTIAILVLVAGFWFLHWRLLEVEAEAIEGLRVDLVHGDGIKALMVEGYLRGSVSYVNADGELVHISRAIPIEWLEDYHVGHPLPLELQNLLKDRVDESL